jgi:hypothetical protein
LPACNVVKICTTLLILPAFIDRPLELIVFSLSLRIPIVWLNPEPQMHFLHLAARRMEARSTVDWHYDYMADVALVSNRNLGLCPVPLALLFCPSFSPIGVVERLNNRWPINHRFCIDNRPAE